MIVYFNKRKGEQLIQIPSLEPKNISHQLSKAITQNLTKRLIYLLCLSGVKQHKKQKLVDESMKLW